MKVEKQEQGTLSSTPKISSIHSTDETNITNMNHLSKNECSKILYQPLTPPSPKTTSTAYASKLLQQLQIQRSNSKTEKHITSSDHFYMGNNPLNQLAEISLAAAAAAHATSSSRGRYEYVNVSNSITKQNIIANLMFPSLLQHIQQQKQQEQYDKEQLHKRSASVHSVPTPINTPSPPPAHLSPPNEYQLQNTDPVPKNSALMRILSKPTLNQRPPLAHNQLPIAHLTNEFSGSNTKTSKSSDHANNYGAINRLQFIDTKPMPIQLPPPQSAPEDLSISKIARKLNFIDSSNENEVLDFTSRERNLPQPQQLLINSVLQTALPLTSIDRISVESRSSSGSSSGHHECQDCGKVYSTSSNLARHRQTHR